MKAMFEGFKWKPSSVVFYRFYFHTTWCHFTGNEAEKRRSFWTFKVTLDAVAMVAAYAALVTLPHHETVTMRITLLRFPHEADVTVSTAERCHGWSMASEAVSSAQQGENKYILYSQPPLPLCPHMCEIKAIMTLHLTENAISLAKMSHLLKY